MHDAKWWLALAAALLFGCTPVPGGEDDGGAGGHVEADGGGEGDGEGEGEGEGEGCPNGDADLDLLCDDEDHVCNSDGSLLACRRVEPPCPEGTVPEVRDGCYTDVCMTWEACADATQAPGPCDPIVEGEFGACEALIGWGLNQDGRCAPVSGCGCDEGCEGRVFESVEACEAMCGAPECERDADDDDICDDEDRECNADGTPVQCRVVQPVCREGTVPEVRNNCYTRRCVTWAECGEPCGDRDDDGICDEVDPICNLDGRPVECDVVEPRCGEGMIPSARDGCYTNECVPIERCASEPAMCGGIAGFPCPERAQICVDDPRDDCDPERGGADCGGLCLEPEDVCAPVRPGEFGACLAVIGWAVGGDGGCVQVSGCGCDLRCAGRVFGSERACLGACLRD